MFTGGSPEVRYLAQGYNHSQEAEKWTPDFWAVGQGPPQLQCTPGTKGHFIRMGYSIYTLLILLAIILLHAKSLCDYRGDSPIEADYFSVSTEHRFYSINLWHGNISHVTNRRKKNRISSQRKLTIHAVGWLVNKAEERKTSLKVFISVLSVFLHGITGAYIFTQSIFLNLTSLALPKPTEDYNYFYSALCFFQVSNYSLAQGARKSYVHVPC